MDSGTPGNLKYEYIKKYMKKERKYG